MLRKLQYSLTLFLLGAEATVPQKEWHSFIFFSGMSDVSLQTLIFCPGNSEGLTGAKL